MQFTGTVQSFDADEGRLHRARARPPCGRRAVRETTAEVRLAAPTPAG